MLRCTLFSYLAAGFYRLMLFYGLFLLFHPCRNQYSRRLDSWGYYNSEWTGYYNSCYFLVADWSESKELRL